MVPRSTNRIFVVDDEPMIRLDIANQLRETGCGVIEASCADKATERLPRVTFARVLTEIDKPGTFKVSTGMGRPPVRPGASVVLMPR
jgi:DNA-binding NtrC family response regulator